MEIRYNAFISYRHSELDMYVAKRIHKGLETFKVPGPVYKATGIKKIDRVFRDQEELPIGSDLSDNITSAIQSSEFLIVICSPRTPESEWVQKEISSFISYHGRDHILAVLVEGEPGESFPQELLVDDNGNPVEPLAADVRGMNKGEIDRKLKTELLRLAAPILHCTYDDLRQRHRERRNKKIFTITAATLSFFAVLGIAFGLYYAHNAAVIKKALIESQINHSKFLAAESQEAMRNGDREAAVLLAKEALSSEDEFYVASAEYALNQALHTYDVGKKVKPDRQFTTNNQIRDFNFDEAGKYITAVDYVSYVTVWDVETGNEEFFVDRVGKTTFSYKVIDANVIDDNLVILASTGIYIVDKAGNVETIYESEDYAAFGKIDYINKVAVVEYGNNLFSFDLSSKKQIGRLDSEDGKQFFTPYYFSNDGKYIAIPKNSDDEEPGVMCVYETNGLKQIEFDITGNYVSAERFLQNGDLVVYTLNADDIYRINNSSDSFLECFDCNAKVRKWKVVVPRLKDISITNTVSINSRIYTDSDGIERNEVILVTNNSVYTFDGNTGELINELGISSVANVLLSASSSVAYVAQKTGTLMVCDLVTSDVYTSNSIYTDLYISKLQVKNQHFALYDSGDYSVTILSYHNGLDDEVIETEATGIYFVDANEDYSILAFKDLDYNYYFVDGNTQEIIAQISEPTYEVCGFVSKEEFLFITQDGGFKFFNVKTQSIDQIDTEAEYVSIDESRIDRENHRALVAEFHSIAIIDTEEHKLIYSGEKDSNSKVYDLKNLVYYGYYISEKCFVKTDIMTGELTKIFDNESVDEGNFTDFTLFLSPSGNYLAITCPDSKIRIINTKTGEIENELPMMSNTESYIEFTKDERKLYARGAGKRIALFDLETSEVQFISSKEYSSYIKIIDMPENNKVIFKESDDLDIYDKEGMELINSIEAGACYDPVNKAIWSTKYGEIHKFPYLDLEGLFEESERQFPDSSLTQEQRAKYFVD